MMRAERLWMSFSFNPDALGFCDAISATHCDAAIWFRSSATSLGLPSPTSDVVSGISALAIFFDDIFGIESKKWSAKES